MEFVETLRRWLGQVAPVVQPDPGPLLAQLQSEQPAERWLAAEGLGAFDPGPEGLALLAEALADPDPILRWQAGASLARIGTSAARATLLATLTGGESLGRAAAADALRLLPPEPEIAATLLSALDSRDAVVRQCAAEALAVHPMPGGQALLLRLLRTDPAPLVRRAAVLAAGSLSSPMAKESLIACANNEAEDPVVREAAGVALMRLLGRTEIVDLKGPGV